MLNTIEFDLNFIFIFDSENRLVFKNKKAIFKAIKFVYETMKHSYFEVKEHIEVKRSYSIFPQMMSYPGHIDLVCRDAVSRGLHIPTTISAVCNLETEDTGVEKILLIFKECFPNDYQYREYESGYVIDKPTSKLKKGFGVVEENKNSIFYQEIYIPSDVSLQIKNFKVGEKNISNVSSGNIPIF